MANITCDAVETHRPHRLPLREIGLYCTLGLTAAVLLAVGLDWVIQSTLHDVGSIMVAA